MKRLIETENHPKRRKRSWLLRLALRLRHWLDRFVSQDEGVSAEAGQVGAQQAAVSTPEAVAPTEAAGPPEHWIELVREHAPQLLKHTADRKSLTRTAAELHWAGQVRKRTRDQAPKSERSVPQRFDVSQPLVPTSLNRDLAVPAANTASASCLLVPQFPVDARRLPSSAPTLVHRKAEPAEKACGISSRLVPTEKKSANVSEIIPAVQRSDRRPGFKRSAAGESGFGTVSELVEPPAPRPARPACPPGSETTPKQSDAARAQHKPEKTISVGHLDGSTRPVPREQPERSAPTAARVERSGPDAELDVEISSSNFQPVHGKTKTVEWPDLGEILSRHSRGVGAPLVPFAKSNEPLVRREGDQRSSSRHPNPGPAPDQVAASASRGWPEAEPELWPALPEERSFETEGEVPAFRESERVRSLDVEQKGGA